MRSPRALSLAATLAFVGATSFAGAMAQADPSAELQNYLDSMETLRADFVQVSQDPNSRRDRVSEGEVMLEKPGKFRWDYEAPYEQLIVSDGERVWHYDVDLEQVTVQPLANSMGSTPLGLLMGDAPIASGFEVSALESGHQERWFELRPLDPGSQFQVLRLALSKGEIAAMELDDALGQTTKLRFSGVVRNRPIEPTLLRFTPPPGVDVVGEG